MLSAQLVTILVLLALGLPPIAPPALLLGTGINQEVHVPVKTLFMITDQHQSALLAITAVNHASTVPSVSPVMTQNKDILQVHQLTVSVKTGTSILVFKPALNATTLASDAVEVQLLNAQLAMMVTIKEVIISVTIARQIV